MKLIAVRCSRRLCKISWDVVSVCCESFEEVVFVACIRIAGL
jgi:hypothetical protein